MNIAHRRRTDCRLCGSSDLVEALRLAPTPPANAFVPEDALDVEQRNFPLDVMFCRECGHTQLGDVVDPSVLFETYVYVSGTAPGFVAHFETYARTCMERAGLKPGDLVVEIGSNDGTLLKCFQAAGMRVLGIDPAQQIAARATETGIETRAAFFTKRLAEEIKSEIGEARLICANNVFAHIDDLAGATQGIAALLASDGVFVFEVSYLVDILRKTLFDTIYHEHLDYHAAGPLMGFFARHGLSLYDAERIDTHGGSLRGYVQHSSGARAGSGLEPLLALEARVGATDEGVLKRFGRDIDAKGGALRAILGGLRKAGKTIGGFGAPAKATTLMHHFGIGPDIIDFVVDDNPLKQGLFTPGMHIPVVPATEIPRRNPDALVILAWNFADPIMAKSAQFKQSGGVFVVPLPEPRTA